jgi:hypothetical protein
MYRQGTNNKVTPVANRTPNAKDVTIGIKNCACTLVSNMIGSKPIKVVNEVRIMGLKRSCPPCKSDSATECPVFLS